MKKVILITGVSGGMGLETAKKFIASGYLVYGLDIKEPKDNVDGLIFIKTDLTRIEDVNNAFNKVNDKLDCIINTAGIYDLNSLIEMEEKDFTRVFDINLFSIYRINRYFIDLLNPKGKIIITSSELAPLDPLPFTGIYGISKAAVEKYA